MTLAGARELVLGVLRSVQGSEPDLDAPLVQAGLDSLGEYEQSILSDPNCSHEVSR